MSIGLTIWCAKLLRYRFYIFCILINWHKIQKSLPLLLWNHQDHHFRCVKFLGYLRFPWDIAIPRVLAPTERWGTHPHLYIHLLHQMILAMRILVSQKHKLVALINTQHFHDWAWNPSRYVGQSIMMLELASLCVQTMPRYQNFRGRYSMSSFYLSLVFTEWCFVLSTFPLWRVRLLAG